MYVVGPIRSRTVMNRSNTLDLLIGATMDAAWHQVMVPVLVVM